MNAPREYHLWTFGLSPDLQRVHPAFGDVDRGFVPPYTVLAVLEKYRQLHGNTPPGESHLTLQTDAGRFVVRLSGKAFSLGAEGQTAAQSVPCTSAEIMTRLEKPAAAALAAPPPPPPAPAAPEPIWRIAVAIALIGLGVALAANALNSLRAAGGTESPDDVEMVTEAADLQARQKMVTGLFVTGQNSGDRQLTISPAGYIVFGEIGPRQSISSGTDTYRLGRRGQQTCLVTTRSSIIETIDADTLTYFGDTYRRVN